MSRNFGSANICVRNFLEKITARKKDINVEPKGLKKFGVTYWNSSRRISEIQTKVGERFRKAALDGNPVILVHGNAQKIRREYSSSTQYMDELEPNDTSKKMNILDV